MNFEQLKNLLNDLNEPKFRFEQICKFYLEKFPNSFDEFTMISKSLREVLEKQIEINDYAVEKLEISRDGTKKALLQLEDGNLIETVYIPLKEGVDTACVSCQVGCGMGCKFCATGQMGFNRNLNFSEIVMQIVFWNKILQKEDKRISRVVFMGMGEPLLNLEDVIKSIKFLSEKFTYGMSFRRFTISTCGITPQLYKLMEYKLEGLKLAISLHAPNDQIRSSIMPVNKNFPLDGLMEFCKFYSKKTQEKIFFEYVMLEGINNSEENAEELAKLLKNVPTAQVNLINYHSTGSEFRSSNINKTLKFQEILKKNGIMAFIRKSAGEDIKAACGQLKSSDR
ncbi:23S rRNA (adenine(2503)-C(2))-methyltransferase [Candidatus Peregrinibacteria bacterium RIFOXYC2_FULL_33_13]|nr:MAG: putative dual-specificity RNA methyltransferase RlmN [Candidatus Peregrinibacteria bacterium GW2011_GWA2_33_10]KKP38770.1 MAG: 50S rRNA methyltransferase [Candidatus Peregrinibacteria bacterium GW2011_GWC2_33_13]OGJ53707.1 MAG: 23S rRNA (adenine(2503)-C(2))-methyltransferase [Candidatus Peregrinibacteria bacterium RIFOXYC2_FULL_33_13]